VLLNCEFSLRQNPCLPSAIRFGYLSYDIGRVLKLPVVRDQLAERILAEADVHRILSLEEDPRNGARLMLLYAPGIRVGELCGLRWQHLSSTSDGGQITMLGKGTKTRSIRLPASVCKLLMALPRGKEVTDPGFVSRKKKPLSPSQLWRIVPAAARGAGIEAKVSPHWMCATPTVPMLSTGARPFISFKLRLGIHLCQPQGGIFMPAPRTARAGSWRYNVPLVDPAACHIRPRSGGASFVEGRTSSGSRLATASNISRAVLSDCLASSCDGSSGSPG
jgi:hypothetical protein